MAYGIGLDIGISSVGWAVVALDEAENPCGILKMGSRIFDSAEHPKDGASLALPRREARSARRRLRRLKHRIERIKALLLKENFLSQDELAHLYDNADGKLEDIYSLRVRALDEKISYKDLARILLHIAHRRGFKSNRKSETADKETGNMLKSISENEKAMKEHGWRTVGEMLLKDERFSGQKRNKGGVYLTTVQRSMVESEVRQIFLAQRKFGNEKASESFEDAYLAILLSQRSFDEGPGNPSPYAGSQIERMIGMDTLDGKEQRAAKATYAFQKFTLLQNVNHIRLSSESEDRALTSEEREKVVALAMRKDKPTYSDIRKALDIPEDFLFNISYAKGEREEAEKKKFNYMSAWHAMRKLLAKAEGCRKIDEIDSSMIDAAGTILTKYKADDHRTEELLAAGFTREEAEALLPLNVSGFGHLSLTNLKKIIPGLEKGMTYNDACTAAGIDFRGHSGTEKSMYLPFIPEKMEDITSPVVLRAVSQTIKVMNAIIRVQGESPLYVNIELAREMARNFKERRDIENSMEENRVANEKLMDEIRRNFKRMNPTGMDLVKYKLFKAQDGRCLYRGKAIDIERLFEPGYVEVDHIMPYSISFNDTYNNKALVFASENRRKGNKLPLQYMSAAQAEDFRVRIENSTLRSAKKRILLKEKFTDEDLNGFKERNLQDTKTMARFLYNYIRDYLLMAPSVTGRKKRVTAVNGAVTAHLRKRWGINKNRANGDLHHAVDALVIACTTDKLIQDVTRHARYEELKYVPGTEESRLVNTRTGELMDRFPLPWHDFRDELTARLSSNPTDVLRRLNLPFYRGEKIEDVKPLFVSRMPRRKVTGAAHKETVKGKTSDKEIVTVKRNLTELKLKNGEIADYYNKESDRPLYNALKAQLIKFGGDAKKAFAEPFHKPKADGTPGPIVKKVKLTEKTTLTVDLHDGSGVADNGSMVRVDVFYREGDGYYLVPIYVADTKKPQLPDKAIVAHKPYEKWKEMDDKDFCFSLYPNDLIRVVHKTGITLKLDKKLAEKSSLEKTKELKDVLLYYAGADISAGSISAVYNDGTYGIHGLGVKKLSALEKFTVDILGNYTKVRKEKRMPFRKD